MGQKQFSFISKEVSTFLNKVCNSESPKDSKNCKVHATNSTFIIFKGLLFLDPDPDFEYL